MQSKSRRFRAQPTLRRDDSIEGTRVRKQRTQPQFCTSKSRPSTQFLSIVFVSFRIRKFGLVFFFFAREATRYITKTLDITKHNRINARLCRKVARAATRTWQCRPRQRQSRIWTLPQSSLFAPSSRTRRPPVCLAAVRCDAGAESVERRAVVHARAQNGSLLVHDKATPSADNRLQMQSAIERAPHAARRMRWQCAPRRLPRLTCTSVRCGKTLRLAVIDALLSAAQSTPTSRIESGPPIVPACCAAAARESASKQKPKSKMLKQRAHHNGCRQIERARSTGQLEHWCKSFTPASHFSILNKFDFCSCLNFCKIKK